ncbi:MAG: hypothetical protein MJY63_02770 [Paludibacteraceae bacterium]|nr:hypothetical protein [Paludibacteraceae bacterium]
MRKTIVKSLMTLLATMTCLSSYAEFTLPKANEKAVYTGDKVAFYFDGTAEEGYTWMYSTTTTNYNSYETATKYGIDASDNYNINYKLVAKSGYATVSGITDGHAYVDLGLDDGTLWSTCNLGAKSIVEFGLYYKWGETTGSTSDISDGTHKYEDENGKYTKYVYDKETETSDYDYLQPEDDAATVNWGKSWSMPTQSQFNALIAGCTWENVKDYNGTGVSGFLGTSKKNGNTIFFAREAMSEMNLWSSNFYAKCGPGAVCNTGERWLFQADYISGKMNSSSNGFSRHFLCIVRPVTTKTGTPTSGKLNATIKKRPLLLGVDGAKGFTYDGEGHAPKYILKDGYNVLNSDAVYPVVVSGAGKTTGTEVNASMNYVTTLELAGDEADNYEISNSNKISWHIMKRDLNVTWPTGDDGNYGFEYDGNNHNPQPEYNYAKNDKGSFGVALTSASGDNRNVGTFTMEVAYSLIPASVLKNYDYDEEDFSKTYTITRAKVSIYYLPQKTFTYNENPVELNVETRSSWKMTGDDVSVKYTIKDKNGKTLTNAVEPGTYTAVLYLDGKDKDNYVFNSNQNDLEFTINKKKVAATDLTYPTLCDPDKVEYDGDGHYPVVAGTSSTKVPGVWKYYVTKGTVTGPYTDLSKFSNTIEKVKEVGIYFTYYTYIPDDEDHYDIIIGYSYSFEITEPEKKVPLAGVDFTAPAPVPYTEYDGNSKLTPGKANKGVEGHFEYCLGEDCSFDGNATAPSIITPSTNSYIVRYRFIPDDKTMSSSEPGEVVVKVTKRGVQVEWDEDETLYYDGKPKLPTKVEISSNKPIVAGDDVVLKVYSEDGYDKVDVGSYSAIAKLEGKDADKYRIIENETHYFYIKSSIFTENVHFTKPVGKSRVYDGESKALFASGKFLGDNYESSELRYRLLNKETLEPETDWSEKIIEKKDAGLYVVEYIAVGNKNMITSESDTIHVIINPAPLKVTWDYTAPYPYDNKTHRPSATVGCVEADKAAFSPQEYKVIDGDLKSPGKHTIELDLDGVSVINNYELPDNLAITFYIAEPAVAVVRDPIVYTDRQYQGRNHKVIVAEDPKLKEDDPKGHYVFTYNEIESVSKIEFAAPGSWTIQYQWISEDDAYSDGPKKDTLVGLGKVPVTFKWPEEEKRTFEADGKPQQIEATTDDIVDDDKDNVNIYYTIKLNGVKVDEAIEPGEYDIEVYLADGVAAYYDLTKSTCNATSKFTIIEPKKTPISLTLKRVKWTYGNTPSAIELTGNESCKGEETYTYYKDNEYTTLTTTADGAVKEGGEPKYPGTYYFKVDVAPTATCEGGSAYASFDIDYKPLIIKWKKEEKYTYNGKNQGPDVDVSGLEGGDGSPIRRSAPGITAGPHTISYSIYMSHYVISEESDESAINYVIEPAELTVTWPDTELPYEEGKEQAPKPNVEGAVNGEEITFSVIGKATAVGKYTATIVLDEEFATNYKIVESETSSASTSFSIVEPTLEPLTDLELSIEGWTYGQPANEPKFIKGNKCGGTESFKYYTDEACTTATTTANGAAVAGGVPAYAGTYYVKGTVAPNESCGEGFDVAEFVIVPETLYVYDWDIEDKEYDGLNNYRPKAKLKNLSGTILIDAFVSYRQDPNGVYYEGLNVGEQKVRADVAEEYRELAFNFVIDNDNRFKEFYVTPAPLTVTWPNTELSYKEGKEQAPMPVVVGAVNNEDIKYSVTGKKTEVGGPYTATIVLEEPYATNYKIVESETSSASTTFSIAIQEMPQFSEPVAEPLTYNGEKQALLKAGTPSVEFQYALGEDGEWTDTIPAEKNANEEGYLVRWKYTPSDGSAVVTEEVTVPIKKFVIDGNIWTKREFTYNGEVHTPKVSVDGIKFKGDDLDVVVEGSASKCGHWPVTASLTGTSIANYELAEEQKTNSLVISVNNHFEFVTKIASCLYVYDGQTHELVTEGKYTDQTPGYFEYSVDGGEFTTTVPTQKNANDYVINWRYISLDECNVPTGTESGVFTSKITAKDPKIDWGVDVPYLYDNEPHQPSPVLTDVIAGDDVTVEIEEIDPSPAVNVGTYTAKVKLSGADKNNYSLSEANISKEFHIISSKVNKPILDPTPLVYDSETTHVFFENNGKYVVEGKSSAKEPGTYLVKISPADGYTWSDGTKVPVEETFIIKRISVPYPDEDLTPYFYNGEVQTYKIAENPVYTITGNGRKYVGSYNVIVSLNDINHYMWSDEKVTEVSYEFVISAKTVKLPKVVGDLEYVYDGTEKQFEIIVDNGSILDEANPAGTNADTYSRTVSLDMDENGGYVWEDKTTGPKTFDFVIKPQPVIVPEVSETYFIFDNESHSFIVPSDTAKTPRYSVEMEVESAVGPDTFYATCSLNDKLNYVWDGGNSDDIIIDFIIGNGTIAKPTIEKSFTYTGKPITFVPKNSAYIVEIRDENKELVENPINAGTYSVVVRPASGFAWLDNNNQPISENVKIVEAKVDKPIFNSPYTYDYGEVVFSVPENIHYKIYGDTFGIEPGKYKTTLVLEPNYMWNDSTKTDYVINNVVNKRPINIPKSDSTTFVYSGEEQTYKIVVDPNCTVIGNKQTIAGNYTVSVAINQPEYFMWSDNSVTNKTYKFVILRAKVNEPGVANNTFEYNGDEHKFEIAKSDKYIINSEFASETEVGTYYRTVTLIDTVNYTWVNGSVDDWKVKFTIVAASAKIPSVITEHEYTGSPIVFVSEGDGYTVTNGTKTDVGTYTVTLSLKKGYIWSDGSSLDKEYTSVITPLYVPKPNVKEKTFPYSGSYYSFGFSPNNGYSFIGDTAAKEPGIYKVIVALNPNYIWDDETTVNDTFTFNISKLDVPVPMANGNKFTYNGEEQTYQIFIPEDSLFTVTNNVQTNAGTYTVTVTLKDHLHYQWGDTSIAPKTFDFVIGKYRVQLPTAPRINFIFNNEEQILFVNPSDKYTVGAENEKATMSGEYERKVSLNDKDNYMWVDETTEDKTIKFIIGDGTLDSIAIKHEYVYTGDTIVFVPEDAAYIVENGYGIEVGTYIVKVKPSEGYRWSDSTKTERIDTVVIKPIMVEKPSLVLNYTFNKKTINFNIPVSETYEIIGATSGIEIGDYKVTLNLLPNHMWTDSTENVAEYVFKINKIVVPVPPVDTTTYVYNGKRQSYNIAKDPNINVVGNPQIYAGTYDVTVLLSDIAHSMWSDSTTENKTYQFDIARAKVELPKAVQATFAYDGTRKDFLVVENSRYEVLSKNSSETKVGSYEREVALKDTLNYTWIDGSVTNKNVTFVIENGVIEKPVFVKEYVYNGTQYTFVPESNAYRVENGVQVNAGTYEVIITLNPGYVWSDESDEPIKETVVIKPRPIDKPEFPATNIYTYDDTIRGVEIPDSDGYLVSGVTQTKEPGTYEVVVSLQPNYIWADGELDALKYVYTINKIVVEIPAKSDSVFKYTGTDVTYPIIDTVDYYIVKGHHRTSAGLHYVTVSLSDSLHYVWSNGKTDDIIYEFLIGKFKVDLPRAVIDSFVYDGNIKFLEVVKNDHYDVERINDIARDINVYHRRVMLRDTFNYLWADGTVEDKIVTFYIMESVIPSILVPSDLVYTGDSLTLIPSSPAYTIVNNRALNAGSYDVFVLPNDGYTWPDTTKSSRRFTIIVKPQMVKIPVVAPDTFEYAATPYVYNIPIPKDSLYTVTENVQTEVGDYYAVVSLKDSLNYRWIDSTNTPKLFPFVIKNTDFELGPIVQSKEMDMDVTPGHFAVFDVQMSGRAYKYWITCDSCPGLNVDTVYFNGTVGAIDVFIPDTVKPGVYDLNVYFKSGSVVKSQKVTLRVNYPACDIYIVWGDVLTIDNSSNLFHTYQWYKNGEVIPGATRQYYQEKGNLDGYYSCLVNNELFVGPAYYHNEKPLWINAVGGYGTLSVEIVGTVPTGSTLEIYDVNSLQVISVAAEQFNTFENLTPGVYIVKLDDYEQSVKVIVK